MVIHILGRKDDIKKMQKVSDETKKICEGAGIKAEIKLTHNFSEIPGQSFNAGSTPIIFINEQVEFTGMPDLKLLRSKIIQIRNMG